MYLCVSELLATFFPAMFLASLHEIPEEEFDAVSSVLPSHDSPLTRLHCSDKHMQVHTFALTFALVQVFN